MLRSNPICIARSIQNRPIIPVVAIALAAAFFGCDDPSSVGLELVGGSNGEPVEIVLEPSTFTSERGHDITGGRPRVLAGTVDDPVTGVITARGYLDFSPQTSRSTEFLAGPVTAASVRLIPDYVYGDTLQPGRILLSDVVDEWPETGFRSDSSVSVGSLASETPFVPTDSVVVLDLPPSWITANEATLLAETFADDFHGFRIDGLDANAIVGFSGSSVMQIVSGGDTLNFTVLLSATASERLTPPAPVADRLLVQDTQGPTITLDFDLGADTLSEAVINRIVVQLKADETVIDDQTPLNFARPAPSSFDLVAVTNDSSLVFLDSSSLSDDGDLVFQSDLLRVTYQGRILDQSAVDHLMLAVTASEIGVGATAFVTPTSPVDTPRATITVSRFQK